MLFPLDPIVTIANANRQLALKFFNIAQTSSARQATIGAHALTAIFNPAKFSEILQEAVESRDTLIADTKAAFEEWQESAGDLFSADSEAAQLATAFEPLSTLPAFPFPPFANANMGSMAANS